MVAHQLTSRLILIISLLVITGTAAAQPTCVDYSETLELVWVNTYDDAATDVVRLDHLILTAVANGGLFVYDGSNPCVPWYLANLDIQGNGWELAATDSLALMASHDGNTLHIIDLTNPSAPTSAGTLPLPGRPVDMVAAGGYAHVLCDPDGAKTHGKLVSVDLSDPFAPTTTQTLDVAYQAVALDLEGDLLAVAGPLMPNLLLLDLGPSGRPSPLGNWHGGGLIRDVDLDGNTAWVAGHGVLQQIDILNPDMPAMAWTHPEPQAWVRLVVEDDQAYLLSHPDDESAFGLTVIDLTAPDAPAVVVTSLSGGALNVDAGWITMVGPEGTMVTLDARNLKHIESLSELPPPLDGDSVIDVAADGNVAVALVDGTSDQGVPVSKLMVIDVSDPLAPVAGGTIEMIHEPRAVALHNTLAAVVSYQQNLSRGEVTLVDVSDPASPQLLSTFLVMGEPQDVNLRGEYLDLLVRGTGVSGFDDHWQVLVITNPYNPIPIIPAPLPGVPFAFGSDGDRMMLVGDGYLDYYDLSEPLFPSLIDSWLINNIFSSVALNGTDIVFGGEGFLLTGDFDEPGLLDLHTSVWLPGLCRDLSVVDGVAYAAAGDLVAVDVSLIEQPRWAGMMGAEAGRGVAVNDGVVLGAAGQGGVQLLRAHCDGGVGISEDEDQDSEPTDDLPSITTLGQPRPNPFNPRVSVPFTLARPGLVHITIHDALGRRVATLTDERWPQGEHELMWDGRSDDHRAAPTGLYLLRMTTEAGTTSRKMSLVR